MLTAGLLARLSDMNSHDIVHYSQVQSRHVCALTDYMSASLQSALIYTATYHGSSPAAPVAMCERHRWRPNTASRSQSCPITYSIPDADHDTDTLKRCVWH